MVEAIAGRGEPARPPVLGPVKLVIESFRAVRATAPEMALLWLVSTGLIVGLQFAARAAGVSLSRLSLSWASVGFMLGSILAASVVSTLALRLLLQGRAAWLRLDTPFLQCAGLLTGAQLLAQLVATLAYGAGGAVQTMPSGLHALAASAAALGLQFIMAKLALWPVARLAERNDIGPEKAWRLMRRTVRSLVLALILLSTPTAIVTFGAIGSGRFNMLSPPAWYLAVATCLSSAAGLFLQGVIIAIWRRRAEARDVTAEVFG